MKEGMIRFNYDSGSIRFSEDAVKKTITEIINDLYVERGIKAKHIPVKFYSKKEKSGVVGYFEFCGDQPVEFGFNLELISELGITVSQLRDTVGHEFAHFEAHYKNGPEAGKNGGHNAVWRAICIDSGVNPSPYLSPRRTRRINLDNWNK